MTAWRAAKAANILTFDVSFFCFMFVSLGDEIKFIQKINLSFCLNFFRRFNCKTSECMFQLNYGAFLRQWLSCFFCSLKELSFRPKFYHFLTVVNLHSCRFNQHRGRHTWVCWGLRGGISTAGFRQLGNRVQFNGSSLFLRSVRVSNVCERW